jgi:hypothetical protein
MVSARVLHALLASMGLSWRSSGSQSCPSGARMPGTTNWVRASGQNIDVEHARGDLGGPSVLSDTGVVDQDIHATEALHGLVRRARLLEETNHRID